MKQTKVDVLIIGAGPAGLAAAIELKKQGINTVRVVERENVAGGVPRHSFHPGYGVRDLKRFISGPKYANTYIKKALSAGVEINTNTTATNSSSPKGTPTSWTRYTLRPWDGFRRGINGISTSSASRRVRR